MKLKETITDISMAKNEHCIYERTDDGCRWCQLGICSCAGCKERILSNSTNK